MRQFRYFAAIVLAICFIVLVIILLFGGHSSSKITPATTQALLDKYSHNGSTATLIIDGPVNATSDHQQMRIDVNASNVNFELLSGYDGQVVSQKVYPNSAASYEAFIGALQQANYTQGNIDTNAPQLASQCPLGERYQFIVTDSNDKKAQDFWSTSCGGQGTYGGKMPGTLTLFQAQVPDFQDLSNGFHY